MRCYLLQDVSLRTQIGVFVLSPGPLIKPDPTPKPQPEVRISTPSEDEAIDLQEDDDDAVPVVAAAANASAADNEEEKKKSEAAKQVLA